MRSILSILAIVLLSAALTGCGLTDGAAGGPATPPTAAPAATATPLVATPDPAAATVTPQAVATATPLPTTTQQPTATAMPTVAIPATSVPVGSPPVAQATQAVQNFLATWSSGGDVRPFLARNLQDELAAGRPLDQTLGLHPITMQSYAVHGPRFPPAEAAFIGATLTYANPGNGGTFSEERDFIMVVEQGEWKVSAIVTPQPAQPPAGDPQPQPAASPQEAVDRLLAATLSDNTLQSALPYLGGDLREAAANGQIDAGSLLQQQNPHQSYIVDQVIGRNDQNVYVQATLFYGAPYGFPRIFTVSDRDGAWRVYAVNMPDPQGSPVPGRVEWPGPGWQLLHSGDSDNNSLVETIKYLPSAVTPASELSGPGYAGYNLTAEQIVIGHSWPDAGTTTMLTISPTGIMAHDKHLASFGSDERQPAAFLVKGPQADGVLVSVIPLNADGSAYGQGVGVYWNSEQNAYRLFAGGQRMP